MRIRTSFLLKHEQAQNGKDNRNLLARLGARRRGRDEDIRAKEYEQKVLPKAREKFSKERSHVVLQTEENDQQKLRRNETNPDQQEALKKSPRSQFSTRQSRIVRSLSFP